MAKNDMSNQAINIGIAILVLSIIVGSLAVPYFTDTSQSGLYYDHDNNESTDPILRPNATSTQVLMWGTMLTIGILAGMMLFIYEFKKKRGRR